MSEKWELRVSLVLAIVIVALLLGLSVHLTRPPVVATATVVPTEAAVTATPQPKNTSQPDGPTTGLSVHLTRPPVVATASVTPTEAAATATPQPEDTPQPSRSTSGFVTLWFDDGLQTTYEIAYPALSRRGWQAVLAVVADRDVAEEKFQRDGDPPMSWEMVQELADAGWEISSHSMTHPRLNCITDTQTLEMEIAGSKQSLEERGFEVPSFTFPYGEQGKDAGQEFVSANYLYWRPSLPEINPVPAWRHLTAFFLTADTDEKTVRNWIAETERTGGWLITGFHAILDEPTNLWQHTPGQFEMVLNIIEDSSLEVVLPAEMFQQFGYAEGEVPQLARSAPIPTPTPKPSIPPEMFSSAVTLDIPAIDVYTQIDIALPTDNGDELDFSRLHEVPLWVSYTREIGEPGVALVLGHRQWGPNAKVFARLNELEVGDIVRVVTEFHTFVYYVEEANIVVDPADVWETLEGFDTPTTEAGTSMLALLTCTPYGTDWQRLVVFAALEEVYEN